MRIAWVHSPDEQGTRAWRAIQQLWQASLETALEHIEQSASNTATILSWLQQWAQRLDQSQRDSTGEEALKEAFLPVYERLDVHYNVNKGDQWFAQCSFENSTLIFYFSDGRQETVPFLAPAQPPGKLIGRDDLLCDLKARLLGKKPVALSALNGLPGVGKTALAVTLAYDAEVLDHFSGGILWAGLGRNASETDTLSRLGIWGTALGIPQIEMEKLPDVKARQARIQATIGQRRMLLVVDDVWDISLARQFKVGGSNCAYLITTRLPEIATRYANEGMIVVHELSEADSLLLLKHLAPKVVESEPREARELVQAVGGLPLALMLMGHYLRVKALSGQPRRLREGLDRLHQAEERLKIDEPQGEREFHPSLPAQTPLSLKAVIAVSDEALDEAARLELRAISVFPPKPNTFSEDAALAVSALPAGALDLLIDQGLLESSGLRRYTLHQTIADYASGRRTDALVEMRMAEYFASYVDNRNKRSARDLEGDEVNIRRALELAHDKRYTKLVVKICMGMQVFWRNAGRREASLLYLPWGIEAAEAVAKRTCKREDRLSQARLIYTYGQVFFQMGSPDDAMANYTKSLAIYREVGDKQMEGIILAALGRLELSLGHMDKAEQYCQQALRIHQDGNFRYEEGISLSSLGEIALRSRQFEKAEQYCQQALAIRREPGIKNRRGERIDLGNLGQIALGRGQLAQATDYFQQTLIISREGNVADRRGEAHSLHNLGEVSLAFSQLKEAEERDDHLQQAEYYLQEALSMHQEVLDLEGESVTLSLLADLAKARNNMERAEELYQKALTGFRKGRFGRHIADTLLTLGCFLIEQWDRKEKGCPMLLEAEQLYTQMGILTAEMELPSGLTTKM